jgi:histidinol-phosphatase (PHP family)
MSDHTPLPDGWTSSIRMDIEELEGYLQAVRQAEIQTGIQVIPGMECDIDAQYFPFYRDELLAPGRCRYLIGAVHYYRHKGELFYAADIPGWAHLASYTDTLIQGITSGIFSFIAHPDHFAADWDRWDADAKSCSLAISEAAKSAGIPLEINGNGFRKQRVNSMSGPRPPYPWRPFWETAAQCRVEVIANSDAHRPQDIAASLDECAALAQELGLEYGKVRLTEK